MNIETHMLIASVLWLYKPNKPEYFNNHKHKLNTQHLKLIIRTRESSYEKITTALDLQNNKLFRIEIWRRNKLILFIWYCSTYTEMIDE